MLRSFRKNIQSWFLKIILIGVALTFISWGAGYFSGGSQVAETKVVATVEGLPITWGEYQNAYKQRIETYRRLFQNKLDDDMIERLKLSDQALTSLLENRLMLVIADEAGLKVSDEEVVRYIEGHPAFQVGGYFNRNTYVGRLQNLGVSPAEYEDSIRQLLKIEQVQETFKDGIHVTESELRAAYRQEQEQVSTTFLLLKSSDFAQGVEVTDGALETFYQEHKGEFTVPERRKVAYLTYRPKTYLEEVTIDEERLREHYELNIDKYRKPERIRARHILLELDQNAPAAEEAKVRARAEALLKEAEEGKDFAELAKANSQGPTAPKGGDLGFFGRGRMVKPFEEAAFALKVGEVGGPVRTPFGYHIIKVEEREPEAVREFDEVKADIRKALVEEEARYLAQDAAYATVESIRSATVQGEEALAGVEGAVLSTTGLFSRDEPLDKLGPDQEAFRSTAFTLLEGEVSDVIEGESNSYIMALTSVEPEHVPPLKEIRPQVVAAYRKLQGRQRAVSEAEALASSVESVDGLAKGAKRLKLSTAPTSTGWFTRQGPVSKVETAADYIRAAFRLKPGSFAAVAAPEGAYVLTVTGLKGVTDEGFASARKDLEKRLRAQKANEVYAAWVQRLLQTREVDVNKEFFPDYTLAEK